MKNMIVAILMLTIAASFAFSQPLVPKNKNDESRKKWEVSLGFGMGNASVYFDEEGNSVTYVTDSLAIVGNDTIVDYTFQMTDYVIMPKVKWMPTEELSISGQMNISLSYLDERYVYDSLYYQQNRAKLSLFQVESFAINADYLMLKSPLKIYMTGGLSLPFGFHNGQTDDPDYPYLSDGALETRIGTKLDYFGDGVKLSAGALYNWRDEDLEPRMVYHLGFALLTVKDTELAGVLKAYMPFKSQSEMPKFSLRHRPLNEETLQAGFSFKMYFENDLFAQVGYNVNLIGKNSIGYGVFVLNTGFRF